MDAATGTPAALRVGAPSIGEPSWSPTPKWWVSLATAYGAANAPTPGGVPLKKP